MSKSGHNISSEDNEISVIIPVYNDPDGISMTLDSLVDQDYPPNLYEIVVVDNDSDDETIEVVLDYQENYPRIVKLSRETEIQSSYAARNTGIREAEGEIIAFLDSDMWVDSDYLKGVSHTFNKVLSKEEDLVYMGFDVDIVIDKDNLSGWYDKVTGFPIEKYMKKQHYCPTCCLATTKEVFEKIGHFDERLISSGDKEFGQRAYREEIKFHFESDLKLYHPARSSIRSLAKKWFRIGRGIYQVQNLYEKRYNEEKRKLLDLAYCIPPSPEVISELMEMSEDLGLSKKIGLILLKWGEKIFTHYGYLYQTSSD